MRYTHVSERPIAALRDTLVSGGPAVRSGKPAGFWLAPGLTWIELLARRPELGGTEVLGSWDVAGSVGAVRKGDDFRFTKEIYDDVLGDKRIPDYGPGTALADVDISSATGKTHFVYQFDIPDDRISEAPSLQTIRRLTASTLDAFLAEVPPWYASVAGTSPATPKDASFASQLAMFFRMSLAPQWGGILFDKSLFTSELTTAHPWIRDLEVESLCLWHPTQILTLQPDSLVAVITIVGSKAVLDKKLAGVSYLNMPPLEPYRSKLYVAGLLADKSGVVMILRKGQGELKGGGRGRTFRRKPKRRNKNGGRSTRKSQRHRHK